MPLFQYLQFRPQTSFAPLTSTLPGSGTTYSLTFDLKTGRDVQSRKFLLADFTGFVPGDSDVSTVTSSSGTGAQFFVNPPVRTPTPFTATFRYLGTNVLEGRRELSRWFTVGLIHAIIARPSTATNTDAVVKQAYVTRVEQNVFTKDPEFIVEFTPQYSYWRRPGNYWWSDEDLGLTYTSQPSMSSTANVAGTCLDVPTYPLVRYISTNNQTSVTVSFMERNYGTTSGTLGSVTLRPDTSGVTAWVSNNYIPANTLLLFNFDPEDPSIKYTQYTSMPSNWQTTTSGSTISGGPALPLACNIKPLPPGVTQAIVVRGSTSGGYMNISVPIWRESI